MTLSTFSVQDRRRNARNLLRSEYLRNFLCPLSTDAVAARMHMYQDAPSNVLDEGCARRQLPTGFRVSATKLKGSNGVDDFCSLHTPTLVTTSTPITPHRRRPFPRSSSDRGPPVPSPGRPSSEVPLQFPMTYEEWLEMGCPTTSWSVLLSETLYGPEEAEELFYRAKYSREGTSALPSLPGARGEAGLGSPIDSAATRSASNKGTYPV